MLIPKALAATILLLGVSAATQPQTHLLPGAVVVSVTSALDSTTPKTAQPRCPEGKRVTGGGFRINGGGAHVVPTRLQPVHTNNRDRYDVAAAEDETGVSGSWSVTGYAICSDPLPGMVIRSTTIQDDPASDELSAGSTCSGVSVVMGTGAAVTGGGGQVSVTRTGPLSLVTPSFTAASAKEDPTGYDQPWTLTAYAVCAEVPLSSVGRDFDTSPGDTQSPKSATATCPQGMRVTGAAGTFNIHSSRDVIMQAMVPEAVNGNQPGTRTTVTAHERTPSGGNWSAVAAAHCSN
ncbi:hypothetical protein [Nonomuraea sp. NPDC048826]|uniref:hypothetical protein n=1 Tax=Nonomuraea sp. NPDC048826 TaxID=3364347 RepID=UPI00371294FF